MSETFFTVIHFSFTVPIGSKIKPNGIDRLRDRVGEIQNALELLPSKCAMLPSSPNAVHFDFYVIFSLVELSESQNEYMNITLCCSFNVTSHVTNFATVR